MNFCTVVTKSAIPSARVLARSLRAANPSATLHVLLADRVEGCFDPATEPFTTIMLEDLGHPEIVGPMAFYYSPFELCCALRGMLHEYMWMKTSAPAWVFLDSDILVVSDMSDITNALMSASVLLNPHNTSPARMEFLAYTEFPQLTCGVFNGGFLGVRRCDESRRFIGWFIERLVRYCFYEVKGLFVDQLWLSHVPQFFRDVKQYTNPGANLAHWNLYQRTITGDVQNGLLADGQPLMFVHFSGWNIDDPAGVSKHAPAYLKAPFPQLASWRELGVRYRAALLENGYAASCQWGYAFSRFDNGAPITPNMRLRYYHEFWNGVPQPASPFARGAEFHAAQTPG